MSSVTVKRDTDADWRQLGDSQPYWGVLSHPDFLRENITPEGIENFYLSGRQYIDQMIQTLVKLTGEKPSGPALDFGCGVGRLAEAMAEHVPTTGLDISPGMLELARRRGGKASYTDTLPDGPFGWINSFIVLQHIPPDRGLPAQTPCRCLDSRIRTKGDGATHPLMTISTAIHSIPFGNNVETSVDERKASTRVASTLSDRSPARPTSAIG